MSTRRDVLKGGLATVVTTSLGACEDEVAPPDGLVVLPLTEAPELATVGGWVTHSVTSIFILLIARVDDATVIALDALCTHQQCVLNYRPDERDLSCRCHGSTFTEQGIVTRGPAERSLGRYQTTFDGEVVTVDLLTPG